MGNGAIVAGKTQRELQRGLKAVWDQLDDLDIRTQRTILQAVIDMRKDVVDRLMSLPVTTLDSGVEAWQAVYLQTYNAELTALIDKWATDLHARTGALMGEAADLGAQGMQSSLGPLYQSFAVPGGMGSGIATIGLGPEMVQAAVLYDSAVIKGLASRVSETINGEIQRTVFGGQDRWTAIRNIRTAMAAETGWAGKKIPPGMLGKLTASAMRAERTALMSVFNAASEQVLKNAAPDLPGLKSQWSTHVDKRTDTECIRLDGALKDIGGTFPGGLAAPPKHPNCRCRTLPWMPGWD